MLSYSRNSEVGSMGVGAGLYVYDFVVKSSRSLSHLLMSSCYLSVLLLCTCFCATVKKRWNTMYLYKLV